MRDTQDSFTEYYDGNPEIIPEEYRIFQQSETLEEEIRYYDMFHARFLISLDRGAISYGWTDEIP